MRVDEIQNGVVIDHIPAGKGQKLYELLGLNELNCTVALIRNAVSVKTGKKDIIKIDADFPFNLDIIGFVSPDITVNRIVNGEIVEKHHMDLPEKLIGVVRCKNPRCITSTEQELQHEFRLTDRENRVYRCVYCESKA